MNDQNKLDLDWLKLAAGICGFSSIGMMGYLLMKKAEEMRPLTTHDLDLREYVVLLFLSMKPDILTTDKLNLMAAIQKYYDVADMFVNSTRAHREREAYIAKMKELENNNDKNDNKEKESNGVEKSEQEHNDKKDSESEETQKRR